MASYETSLFYLYDLRLFFPADIHRPAAPGMEPASRRWINKVWYGSRYRFQSFSRLLRHFRYRIDETYRIRVLRIRKYRVNVAQLNDVTRIHDANTVACFGYHP